jgi:hypothetical protein
LRGGNWRDEVVSAWGAGSLDFILAATGVKRWRRYWEDVVVLVSLGRREKIGDKARHDGRRVDVVLYSLQQRKNEGQTAIELDEISLSSNTSWLQLK